MNANDIELALRARAAFNDSVECIDTDTRRRLRELRLRAQRTQKNHTSARWAWPAGAALTAALALVVFLPRMPHAPAATMPAATVVAVTQRAATQAASHHADIAAVAAAVPSDSLEAVDPDLLSDLDFYGWLAKQPANTSPGG